MQATMNRPSGPRANNQALGRAIRYLGRYPKITIISLVALLVATGAQLAVPQLIQNIIDTITENAVAQALLEQPTEIQQLAAERFGLDLPALQVN